MRRFFLIGLAQVNLLFAVAASAQTTVPQAAHHPDVPSRPSTPTTVDTPCPCPMMMHDGAGGPAMHRQGGPGMSAMAGHAHPTSGGMQPCADMRHPSPPARQDKAKP